MEPPNENPAQENPKTVLVVDDEPPILALTCSILSGKGYSVLGAPGGIAALEVSRGHESEIALLITDVVMPDLNGPHLAEQLLNKIPNLRVLFMSGWEPQVIAHEGAFRRGYRTLSKPFSPAGLIEAVQLVLEQPPRMELVRRAGPG